MIILKTQNNFGRGKINRRLQSRIKDPIYEHGVLEATNCLLEPSGLLKKRYGTKFISDISALTGPFVLATFEYSIDANYLLLFYPTKLNIYSQSGTLVATKDTVFDETSLGQLRYDQSVDTMVICDGIHIPQLLVLSVPLLTWSITNISFRTVPSYDFAKNYYSAKFTPSAAYGSVTLTASVPTFSAALVNGMFIGNGAVCRITAYTDTTHITVETLDNTYFFTGTGDPTGTAKDVDGLNAVIKEPMWSAARGWPTNPCLHNNRLWFGGTQLRPQSICGSVIGDYYNFDEGSGLPDDGININIDSQQLNSIQYLVSSNALQAFTNNGVYVINQDQNGNFGAQCESKEGAADVLPIFIDSQVLYAQRGGKIIRNFVFNFDIKGYDNNNITIAASDIIDNPLDCDVLKYNDNESTNYVFFINENGSIAVYQTQRAENIAGWTTLVTDSDASFLACSAVGSTMFFIVKRLIDGVQKFYLEEMDTTTYLDCYLTYHNDLSTKIVTGLEALEGKIVSIIRDGYIEERKTVVGGQVTTQDAGNNFVVGLPIVSDIEPLPLAGEYQFGSTTYWPKTVRNIFLDMDNTYGVKLDGTLVPYFVLGTYILNSIYEGFTGIAKIPYLKNWELRQEMHITHDYPTPFTLCGIGYEVVMEPPS